MSETLSWQLCLDRLAEHLVHQREAVEQGRLEDVVAFEPERGLGPLPASLAPRARDLEAENALLAAALFDASRAVSRELELVLAHAPERRPRFLDSSG